MNLQNIWSLVVGRFLILFLLQNVLQLGFPSKDITTIVRPFWGFNIYTAGG